MDFFSTSVAQLILRLIRSGIGIAVGVILVRLLASALGVEAYSTVLGSLLLAGTFPLGFLAFVGASNIEFREFPGAYGIAPGNDVIGVAVLVHGLTMFGGSLFFVTRAIGLGLGSLSAADQPPAWLASLLGW